MLHINRRNTNRHISYYRGLPPDFENPNAFFEFTDYPKPKGSITQEQILNSVYATLRARNTTQRVFLRSRIQKNWTKWDPNHQMRLKKAEFMHCGIILFLSQLQDEFLKVFCHQNNRTVAITKFRMPIGKPPSLSNPRKWFDHYDLSNDGILSQEEVTQGLFKTFKLKSDKEKDIIRDSIERAWSVFDTDYNGQIDKWEFFVNGGLHDYLILLEKDWKERPSDRTLYHCLNLHVKGARRHSYVPPPPLSKSETWFKHFDIDCSGYLTEKEAIHGLYTTFNAATTEKRSSIRKIVSCSWDDYDEDNDGVISIHEFTKEDGLADMFKGYENGWKNDALPEEDDKGLNLDVIKIKVYIPNNKKTGDILRVSSPKTQEMIMMLIPEKVKWGGGEDEPYFFTVQFD